MDELNDSWVNNDVAVVFVIHENPGMLGFIGV